MPFVVRKISFFILMTTCILSLSAPCRSIATTTTNSNFFGNNKKDPVNIISDKLDFDQKNHIALFSGNVVARQAGTTLTCSKLKIIFSPKDQKPEEIIATGRKVVLTMQNKKAQCQKMHYFASDAKIILSGSPSLDDGKNVITGEQIIFFVNDDRSVVKGGKNRRVKTTIFPGQGDGFWDKGQKSGE